MTWVFRGTDQNKKWFAVVVEYRKDTKLLPIINKYTKPCLIIKLDCWKSYINISNYDYEHQTVKDSKNYKSPDGTHTKKLSTSGAH